ncbi:MAG TPA: hypothetical protein PK014_12295 [Thermoanaerobaculia bacterium]|nr:hypothetical protein [Thermoanaerobaculia bacterium]HUM30839.1 hypothetical protein [Thermoanaerobaculia bacterium]HXK69180.1 hypothetical protein [Thermoanaerobaculia bacterium]
MPTRKRRTKLIAGRHHLLHTLRFNLFAFAVTLIILIILVGPLYLQMTVGGEDPGAYAAAGKLIHVIKYVVPVFLLFVASMIIAEILYSHRFFGPLRRMEMWLDALKNGDLRKNPGFRKGDNLVYLGESYQEALSVVRNHVRETRIILQNTLTREENEAVRSELTRALEILDQLKTD